MPEAHLGLRAHGRTVCAPPLADFRSGYAPGTRRSSRSRLRRRASADRRAPLACRGLRLRKTHIPWNHRAIRISRKYSRSVSVTSAPGWCDHRTCQQHASIVSSGCRRRARVPRSRPAPRSLPDKTRPAAAHHVCAAQRTFSVSSPGRRTIQKDQVVAALDGLESAPQAKRPVLAPASSMLMPVRFFEPGSSHRRSISVGRIVCSAGLSPQAPRR